MTAVEQFVRAWQTGGLVFLTGAGASRESGTPMPDPVLQWSARAFLPLGEAYASRVAMVLDEKTIAGSTFRGIQPEVFYEHALTLRPDPEVLAMWRILSPEWLARRGVRLQPNVNHLALAAFAARHAVPLFTMNFDTLFEEAARELGQLEPEVIVPKTALRAANTKPEMGRLRLVKLHGSIELDGIESLESLSTTMVDITARDDASVALLRRAVQGKRLVLLGYSGSDIDYFPVLRELESADRPIWFDPPGNAVTSDHAQRLSALTIEQFPSTLLRTLDPPPDRWSDPSHPDFQPLLRELSDACSGLLTEAQKVLLLGLSRHSCGLNTEAEQTLTVDEPLLDRHLSGRDRVLAHLVLSRVRDCTSHYRAAIASARLAHDATRQLLADHSVSKGEGAALIMRAIYHRVQAEQQAIGPWVRYGSRAVDWSPARHVLILKLLAGMWGAWRLWRLSGRLPDVADHRFSQERSSVVRARHALNDHLLLVLERVIAVTQQASRTGKPLGRLWGWAAIRVRKMAAESGDYFSYAGAEKQLERLGRGGRGGEAERAVRMLRDPLNFALVQRNRGAECLSTPDPFSRARAIEAFEQAREAGRRSGSAATELKALAGLVASGRTDATILGDLDQALGGIEGAGYAAYGASLRERLPLLGS